VVVEGVFPIRATEFVSFFPPILVIMIKDTKEKRAKPIAP